MRFIQLSQRRHPGFGVKLYRLIGFVLLIGGNFAQAEDRLIPVRISVVESNTVFEEVPLTGSATPRRESSLSPEVDGLVSEILVDEGDTVKKGDVLIKLDRVIAGLDAQQAAAALAEGKERWRETVRQRDESAKLVAKRHVAETAYKALIADAQMNKAALQRLAAEYQRTLKISDRFVIRAPFNGVIGTISAEIGEWVETGDAMLELFDIDTLRIRVPVPQRYFSVIHVGMPVKLNFDALPGQTFTLSVSKKIPIGNPSARTFPVRIDLLNSDRVIAPGMSVRVRFIVSQESASPAVLVPMDSVVNGADGSKTVWRVAGDSDQATVTPVKITTGRSYRTSIEVVSGTLKPGDRVVIRGNEILKPDQRVRLLN